MEVLIAGVTQTSSEIQISRPGWIPNILNTTIANLFSRQRRSPRVDIHTLPAVKPSSSNLPLRSWRCLSYRILHQLAASPFSLISLRCLTVWPAKATLIGTILLLSLPFSEISQWIRSMVINTSLKFPSQLGSDDVRRCQQVYQVPNRLLAAEFLRWLIWGDKHMRPPRNIPASR